MMERVERGTWSRDSLDNFNASAEEMESGF